jgi:PTS system mannitol-specific IIC component
MTTTVADLKHREGPGAQATIQRIGGYLAGMIMPNISAFIAWGLITAIFIPTGWWPNETLAKLVGPIINVLLPVLIGYTGGRLVHGQRGAVIGAVATMGVVVGTDIPMFLGAMIMGPLAAFILKMIDGYVQQRTKSGFEMLVDNFSAGILGLVMAVLGLLAIGPIVENIATAAGNVVNTLVTNNLLPLVSIVVEPAKVLFLNNAINHGVLAPLGVAQSVANGKSILFMIETNPGPGLGILLAYFFFGPRSLRPSTPGAIIIHFFGGIHEIYFPYVLMRPRLILAAIAGGAAGVFTAVVTGAGLVATPSPGSIFAYLAVTPKDGYIGVLLDIIVATGISFGVASMLLGFGRSEEPVVEAATTGAAPTLPIAPTPTGA